MTTLTSALPHPAHIHLADGTILTVPSGDTVARVTMAEPEQTEPVIVDGHQVPLYRTATATAGAVTGLPAPRDGVLILVSRMVAEACPDRGDLVITHDAVRDPAGHIVGVRALAQIERQQ